MLTDEDLTHELGEAFRGATADLTYNGRRSPRRLSPVVPTAIAGVLAAGVIVAVAIAGGSASPSHPHPAFASGHEIVNGPAIVKKSKATEQMTLAAFTAQFEKAARKEGKFPIFAAIVKGGLPSGVREIPTPQTSARAWIGNDPKSGDNALYVKAPTRNGGYLFALYSPSWTKHQLIYLFRHGD